MSDLIVSIIKISQNKSCTRVVRTNVENACEHRENFVMTRISRGGDISIVFEKDEFCNIDCQFGNIC